MLKENEPIDLKLEKELESEFDLAPSAAPKKANKLVIMGALLAGLVGGLFLLYWLMKPTKVNVPVKGNAPMSDTSRASEQERDKVLDDLKAISQPGGQSVLSATASASPGLPSTAPGAQPGVIDPSLVTTVPSGKTSVMAPPGQMAPTGKAGTGSMVPSGGMDAAHSMSGKGNAAQGTAATVVPYKVSFTPQNPGILVKICLRLRLRRWVGFRRRIRRHRRWNALRMRSLLRDRVLVRRFRSRWSASFTLYGRSQWLALW